MSSPPRAALEASFEQLSVTAPANVGIAIARPGRIFSLGRWSTGVAWSTIKVPLAIAALRHDRATAQDLIGKAITESDNHAAEDLWSLLGEPAQAAQRVQTIISESGDSTTVVESQRLRRGFTPFGQTQWSLEGQARFAERLPQIADAAAVIDLMRELSVAHRWGLGAKGIAAKAGWGPGLHGDYLVRQFGMVPTQSGLWGVALAADAEDGVFQTGIEVVNTLSDWLLGHLRELASY